MSLEFADLEYRVRNVLTGNVIAAFLNSTECGQYITQLRANPLWATKPSNPFELETTNYGDGLSKQGPTVEMNLGHEWFATKATDPSGVDAVAAAIRLDDQLREIANGERKAAKISMEDIVTLIAYARIAS